MISLCFILLLFDFYIPHIKCFYTYTMNKKYLKNKTHVVYMNSHILLLTKSYQSLLNLM